MIQEASNLSTIISTGLNNPDCSFFVGTFTGQFLSIKYLIAILIIYAVFKVLDKLALEPLLNLIKSKFKRNEK